MEKEEKAKVILDYDKYQELLERVKWNDLKSRSIEDAAYNKATKEYVSLFLTSNKIATMKC